MPEIKLFYGGFNTHNNSRKLEANEFTQVLDADITSGSVVSIPPSIPSYLTNDEVGECFIDYKGAIISGTSPLLKFERMHNKIFKSDGYVVAHANGEKATSGSYTWSELGISISDEPIIAEALTIDMEELIVTYPPGRGVCTEDRHRYTAILDDGYAYSFFLDIEESCGMVGFDFSSVTTFSGSLTTTVKVYRYWRGYMYLISEDLTFIDFRQPLDYFPTIAAEHTLKTVHTLERKSHKTRSDSKYYGTSHMEWFGDGTMTVDWGKFRGIDYIKATIDFKTGEFEAPADTIKSRLVVTNLGKQVSTGYYDFKLGMYYRRTSVFPWTLIYEVNVTVEGFNVSYVAPAGNQYPNSSEFKYDTSSTICNGRGILLDEDETYTESQVGEFTYFLTYEDATPNEGGAGPISNIVVASAANVGVTIPPLDIDSSIVKVYLYRQNSKVATGYLRVAEWDKAEVEDGLFFVDDVEVGDLTTLAPRRTLASVDARSLFPTAAQGRLFLAVPEDSNDEYSNYRTLIWSYLGDPLSYDSMSYLNVDHPITGLGVCANGLILYHKDEMHILQGIQTEIFNYRPISSSLGCVDHRSIQSWGGYSICASIDGISITDGGTTQLISYDKLGILTLSETDFSGTDLLLGSNILSSAVVENQYFLLLNDETIIKVDLIHNIFTLLSAKGVDGIGAIGGELYSSEDGALKLIKYDIEGTRQYKLVTGDITDGAICNLKEYNKVRIAVTGVAALTVYIDDKAVLRNVNIAKPYDFILIPNEYCRGNSIRFEVTGIGSLHSIEYSVKGRTNG